MLALDGHGIHPATEDVMRRISGFLLLAATVGSVLIPVRANACLVAHQYRLFPLGYSGDRLLALELDLHRDSGPELKNIHWLGKTALVELGGSFEVSARTDLGKIRVPDAGYSEALKETLALALEKARAKEGFRELEGPTLVFCHLADKCAGISYQVTKRGRPRLAMKGKDGKVTSRGVVMPPPAKARYMAMLGLETDAELATYMADDWPGFVITTVRTYQTANGRLQVVGLGAGDEKFARDDVDKLPDDRCKKVDTCIYREPTLHHGHAFDILVLAP